MRAVVDLENGLLTILENHTELIHTPFDESCDIAVIPYGLGEDIILTKDEGEWNVFYDNGNGQKQLNRKLI